MSFRAAALLLAALLPGACSDATGSGAETLKMGVFEATLSGDYSASLEGEANLEGGFDPEVSMGVVMSDWRVPDEVSTVGILFLRQPEPGRYTVGSSGMIHSAHVTVSDRTGTTLILRVPVDQGTIVVEKVSRQQMRGRFDVSGVNAAGRRVRAAGSFHADRPIPNF